MSDETVATPAASAAPAANVSKPAAAPATTTNTVAKTPAAAAAPVAKIYDHPQSDKLAALLNDYVAKMSLPIITPAGLKEGIGLLVSATKTILQEESPVLYQQFLDFHNKHVDGLMSTTMGLRGIDTLTPRDSELVRVVYTAFRSKASGGAVDLKKVSAILRTQSLAAFLS